MNLSPHNTELTEQAKAYLNYGAVPELLKRLQSGSYPVSDVMGEDPETGKTLYFVDLVQQGGGVLGIALVGYTYALEEAGIRFLSLAGTSAGAINTLLLAGTGRPDIAKSRYVLNEISGLQFSRFVDPGWRVLWPFKGIMQRYTLIKVLSGLALFFLNFWGIVFRKGLCSGNRFEQWIKDVMRRYDISSIDALLNLMKNPVKPLSLAQADGTSEPIDPSKLDAQLAIVSADISTQTKVVFPRMAHLYVREIMKKSKSHGQYLHLELPPETIVRASMAIPLFFQPKFFQPPEMGNRRVQDWMDVAGYRGEVPDKVLMVDGGIMSNFPIDVFHISDRPPQRPTFGVRLGLSRENPSRIENVLTLMGAAFNGARNLRDFEFLFHNEDYKHLVMSIDTGDYDWLNFSIAEPDRMKLFELGVQAAHDFLEGREAKNGQEKRAPFNWRQYKALRRRMLFSSSTDRIDSLWTMDDAIRKLGLEKEPGAATGDGLSRRAAFAPQSAVVEAFHEHLALIEDHLRRGNRIVVLWVDDDPANDFFELSILRALGLQFATVTTNADALEKLAADPDIKLVITDSNREGKPDQGLNLCKEMHDRQFDLPVILHSITQAKALEKKAPDEKGEYMESMKKDYSPLIVGNFVETRALVITTVAEIAKSIQEEDA